MLRYRKRPVVIEAEQWHKNGDHSLDGNDPSKEGAIVRRYRRPDVDGFARCDYCTWTMNGHGWIDTLEDGHTVCPGDWIITGVAGERYPCKPHIFDETYDLVHEVRTTESNQVSRIAKLVCVCGWTTTATTGLAEEYAAKNHVAETGREQRDAWQM